MSDYLPFAMQLEIMKRLPLKSLIQFRSVSKAWYSMITSSDFIRSYSAHHTQAQHLLVMSGYDMVDFRDKFVSIVDDATFPDQKVSLDPPLLIKKFYIQGVVIGCSDGLLCISGWSSNRTPMAVIWNISIRKEVAVVLHNTLRNQQISKVGIGFGICRETNDPTIIQITSVETRGKDKDDFAYQVDAFKLSRGVWTSLDSSSFPPCISMRCVSFQVQGCIYWLATKNITLNCEVMSKNLILSFDMKSEEFKLVNLPDTLAYGPDMSLSKLRESLIVCEHVGKATLNIWRMEDGVPNTFTKQVTVNVNVHEHDLNTYIRAYMRGFRNSGEPIVEVSEYDDDIIFSSEYDDDDNEIYKLVVYDPYLKQIKSLGIHGSQPSHHVHPYKESLLLLDQPNLKVYNEQLETVH